MHRLQIFDSQALQIPLRRLHGRVAEDSGEVEEVATLAQVEDGERMPERVETTPDAGNANLAAQDAEVPLEVADGAGRLVAGAEDVPPRVLLDVAEQEFPAFKGDGHPALLVAFAHNRDEQVVKIHVGLFDCAAFVNSQAGIKK